MSANAVVVSSADVPKVAPEEADVDAATTAPVAPPQGGEEGAVEEGASDGMRREWNFTFHIKHFAARAAVRFNPAWTSQFIDPDDIIKLNKLDRDVKHCPMMPFAAYVDDTIALQSGAFWEQSPKSVRIMYSHVPHNMTLKAYCKRSVQHILGDPRVATVDGQSALQRLKVAQKLQHAPQLGGKPSFHFWYVLSDKMKARTEYVYVIGTIAGQRGYLITVTCNKEQELHGYIKNYFAPHFKDPSKFEVDADIVYEEVTNTVLKEQQDLYGELHFHDRDAAVSFAIPMHPVKLRPDFSPIQSVGVGSIACMTLELEVNQKLMDDFAEADITGMPKYKVNNVLLFLDAEDVARMGYPGIMSVEQYSNAKMKRLVEVFKDAKTVGSPISLNLGTRCGRSATVTFTYEGFGCVVKAMMVCTLVGNMGITALYFTKLGGGLFDAHLYLYQQLLKSVVFRAPREQAERFSRYNAVQIRLTDQDLPRCYAAAAVNEKKTLERHLKSLHQSTDGRTDGGRFVPVDLQKGGLVRSTAAPPSSSSHTALDAAAANAAEDVQEDDAESGNDDLSDISVSSIPHLAALPSWDEGSPTGEPQPPPRSYRSAQDPSQGESDGPGSEFPEVTIDVSDGTTMRNDESRGTLNNTDGGDASLTATLTKPLSRNPSTMCEPMPTKSLSRNPSTMCEPMPTKSLSRNPSALGTEPAALDGTVSPLPQQPSSNHLSSNAPETQQQLIQTILKEDEELYFGPSLHDVYIRCCELQRCRPNSYLLKKLPNSPRFTMSVEELDMTSNYLGHNGFVAVLQLLEHLPRLHSVFFNDMSLDNTDVEHMCEVLSTNPSIRSVQLRNNPKVTLPATKQLSRLLRSNRRITSLVLHGTKIGPSLIASLEAEALRNNKDDAPTSPRNAST